METNIVEVENFVQQSEERRGSAFTQEVKRYLERYPNTQYDERYRMETKRLPASVHSLFTYESAPRHAESKMWIEK